MNPIQQVLSFLAGLFPARKAPPQEPAAAPAEGKITMGRDGLIVLRHFEGLRLTAYQDLVGVWTIGYGHTGPDVYRGLTISQERANELLQQRLDLEFVPGVLLVVTRSLAQHELDAMVDLAYNVGLAAFQSSTLVKKFNAGDVAGAADEFLRWDKAGGKSVKGLRRRRAADRALFLGSTGPEAIKVGESVA